MLVHCPPRDLQWRQGRPLSHLIRRARHHSQARCTCFRENLDTGELKGGGPAGKLPKGLVMVLVHESRGPWTKRLEKARRCGFEGGLKSVFSLVGLSKNEDVDTELTEGECGPTIRHSCSYDWFTQGVMWGATPPRH